jgi:hypothetical protein
MSRGCLIVGCAVWLVFLAPTLFVPILHFFTFPLFVLMFIVLILAAFTPRRAYSNQPTLTPLALPGTANLNAEALRARKDATTTVTLAAILLAVLVVAGIFANNLSSSPGNDSNSKIASAKGSRSDPPTRTVAAFYDAISRKDFTAAWNRLSPSFQRDGSFEKFRSGYATTQSVSVSVAEVPGQPQKVRTSLDAIDLVNGNAVHSHFAGWWILTRASDGRWLLDDGRFTKTP